MASIDIVLVPTSLEREVRDGDYGGVMRVWVDVCMSICFWDSRGSRDLLPFMNSKSSDGWQWTWEPLTLLITEDSRGVTGGGDGTIKPSCLDKDQQVTRFLAACPLLLIWTTCALSSNNLQGWEWAPQIDWCWTSCQPRWQQPPSGFDVT